MVSMAIDVGNGSETNLQQVESQLKGIIEMLIDMGIMIHDFQGTADSKEALVEQTNTLVSDLNELNRTSIQLKHTVPIDVVEYIENGRNPDVYTREFVEILAKQNQYLNGKMKAMRDFRDILGQAIKDSYPDLENVVNNVLVRTGGTDSDIK